MNQHALLLEKVKDIDLVMLNHVSQDVRHKWADKCDALMGEKTHWDDVTEEGLGSMVEFAKELVK